MNSTRAPTGLPKGPNNETRAAFPTIMVNSGMRRTAHSMVVERRKRLDLEGGGRSGDKKRSST
jgi:hypothetical protein